MPGFDGTGPRGEGPMTGGARGFCAQPYTAGYARGGGYGRVGARGFGHGRGFGRGRDFGRGYGRGNWAVDPYDGPYPYAMTQKDEMKLLRDESEMLRQELESIQKRIKDLENSKS